MDYQHNTNEKTEPYDHVAIMGTIDPNNFSIYYYAHTTRRYGGKNGKYNQFKKSLQKVFDEYKNYKVKMSFCIIK